MYKYDNVGVMAAISQICGINNKLEILSDINNDYIKVCRNDNDNIIVPKYEVLNTINNINSIFYGDRKYKNRVCYVLDEHTIVYNDKYMNMFGKLVDSLNTIDCLVDIICTQDTIHTLTELAKVHSNINIWLPFNLDNIGYYCNDNLSCKESTLVIENMTLLDLINRYIKETGSNKIILTTRKHLDIHDTITNKYSDINIYYDLHIVEFSEKCVMTNENITDVYRLLKDKNIIVYLDDIKNMILDEIPSITTLSYPKDIAQAVYINIFKDNSILFEFHDDEIDYSVLEILCLVGLNVDIIVQDEQMLTNVKNKIALDRRYSNIKTIYSENNMPNTFGKLFYSKYRLYINNKNNEKVLHMSNILKTITVLSDVDFTNTENIINIDINDKISTVKTIIATHGYLFNTKTYNSSEVEHIDNFESKWNMFLNT